MKQRTLLIRPDKEPERHLGSHPYLIKQLNQLRDARAQVAPAAATSSANTSRRHDRQGTSRKPACPMAAAFHSQKPHSVLLTATVEQLADLIKPIRHIDHQVPIAALCSGFDCEPSPVALQALASLSQVIVPSRHTARQLAPLLTTPPVVLPTPVNQDRYQPVNGKLEDFWRRRYLTRQKLVPDSPELWTGFWILKNSAADTIEQLTTTLRGFAEFIRISGDEAFLCLREDHPARRQQLLQLAVALDIGDRLVFPAAGSHPNMLYNATDIGLHDTTSEAWDIGSFEHAATGAPQILRNSADHREVWNQGAILLDTTKGKDPVTNLAESLARLYNNPLLYQQSARHAHRVATAQPGWRGVARHLHRALQDIETRRRPAARLLYRGFPITL